MTLEQRALTVLMVLAWSPIGCGNTGESTGSSEDTGGTGGSSATVGSGGASATVGSGGTGGMAQHYPGASSVAEMCATFPAAWGAYMARCHGGEPEEWQSLVSTLCGPAARSENEGRITLNADNAQACLAHLASDTCIIDPFQDPCGHLFTGSIPRGGICNRLELHGGDECEPGAFCRAETLGTCNSVCSPILELGEGCTGKDNISPCADGLVCDPDSGCVVPAAEGEACTQLYGCEPGFYCDLQANSEDFPGSCQRAKAEGPCEFVYQCAPGYQCMGEVEGERNCMRFKPVGAACAFGFNECEGQCSLEGQCQVASKDGEPCAYVEDPTTSKGETFSCASGLFCDPEVQLCRPLLEPGTSCPGIGIFACAGEGEGLGDCDSGQCASCD